MDRLQFEERLAHLLRVYESSGDGLVMNIHVDRLPSGMSGDVEVEYLNPSL